MKSGFGRGCKCDDKNRRDNWRIVNYQCNYSAFNGYKRTPSDYSLIRCLECGSYWRTKAKYVDELKFMLKFM